MSRHERNNRDEAQNAEHRSILEGSVENNERAIARKEEEEPCDEENQEDDHGDGIPEQTEEHDQQHYGGVVELEVTEVLSETDHGVVVGEGAGDG